MLLFAWLLLVVISSSLYIAPSNDHSKDFTAGSLGEKQDTAIKLGALKLRPENDEKTEVQGPDIDEVNLPVELNSKTFDEVTSQMPTFVEFYSPYCPHCKALLPTWKNTYQSYRIQLQGMGIQMRQVNCVENGDLCDKEDVRFYPNLRLYVPLKDKLTKEPVRGRSKFVDSFPRTLPPSKENLIKYMKTGAAEYIEGSSGFPSSSSVLSVDELSQAIAGDHNEALFVAFFPSTDEQLSSLDVKGKSPFSRYCEDCLAAKHVWDKLSNRILSVVKTAHFNCISNPNVCEKLGFVELTSKSRYSSPKFVMFLPKSTGLIRVDYPGSISLEKMKSFAFKLFENHQYETLSISSLSDVISLSEDLPLGPVHNELPINNKVAAIFFFDDKTLSEEDKSVFPYLLEYVTKSPFNFNLFTGKSKKYETTIRSQAVNLVKYVHENKDMALTEEEANFNHAMFLATTLTSKPTLLIFKDNSLMTNIYQSFAPEDIRNAPKLEEFIRRNQYPLHHKLTSDIVDAYFNNFEEDDHKVVVTFIKSDNVKETDTALYNISLAAHQYYYYKKRYYFENLLRNRQTKDEVIQQLMRTNENNLEIIEQMKQEIPHFFQNDDVLFTYVDLADTDDLTVRGRKLKKSDFSEGDSVIFSKDGKYYWDTGYDGKRLVNEPRMIHKTLLGLLDSYTFGGDKLNKKLAGSPYGSYFRFMDIIHERGVIGYACIAGVVYFSSKLVKYIRRRRSTPKLGSGLLGNPISKKD